MIRLICRCGGVAKVEDALAGKKIPCPRCGAPLTVRSQARRGEASPEPEPRPEPEPSPEGPKPPTAAQESPARPEEALGALATAASLKKDQPEAAKAPPRPAPPAGGKPAAAAHRPQPGAPQKAPAPRAAAAGQAGAHRPQVSGPAKVRRPTTMETRPSSAPAAPLPDAAAKARAVLFGLAMLATICIPWGLKDGKVVMSWQILQRAGTWPILLLVAVWVIGLATVLAGALLRRLALAGSCLVLSAIGLATVLYSDQGVLELAPWLEAARPLFRKTLFVLAALVLMAQMITTRLRLRQGRGLATRAAQGSFGAGAVVVAVLAVILLIADYTGLKQDVREALFYDFLSFLGLWVCLLVAGLLATAHAAATAGGPSRGRLALLLDHLVIIASLAYVIGRLAFSTGGAERMLPAVNVCLLFAAPWWLGKFAVGATTARLKERISSAARRASARGGRSV